MFTFTERSGRFVLLQELEFHKRLGKELSLGKLNEVIKRNRTDKGKTTSVIQAALIRFLAS